MQESFDPKRGQYGPGTPEEATQRSSAESQAIAQNIYMMRPLENLRTTPILEMERQEVEPVIEAMRQTSVELQNSLFHRLGFGSETYRYKTEFYTTQSEREMAMRQVGMLENMIYGLPDRIGFSANEKLLTLQANEINRGVAALNVWEWALPYKATYYGGLDSMAILPQRGGQLYLGNMEMMVNGVDSELFEEGRPEPLTELDPEQFPEVDVKRREVDIKRREAEIALWDNIKEIMPNTENGETMADRYGRYVADSDFVWRALGEMVTYNSTIPGEELRLTETMENFLGETFQRQSRTLETGAREVISGPTRKINVYLDANGNQIAQNDDGTPVRPLGPGEVMREQFVDVLDFYNNARSDEESRYVICATAAMAIHGAKDILESLPPDINTARRVRAADGQNPVYVDLFNKVQATAKDMMRHWNKPRRKDTNYMLAKSAVLMGDAIAYGSMDIGERGGSYSWKLVKTGDNTYRWRTEPGQGDPTAAGDAFTAHKPLLHEAIYQAIKSRVSAFGQGLQIPIDGAEKSALKTLEVLMSKDAERNDRKEVVRMVGQGKQLHLATYFGMLGAFEKEFTDPTDPNYANSAEARKAWQNGVAERKRLGKSVNENFSRAVEQHVIFVRTPFNFKNVREAGLKPTEKANGLIESFRIGDDNVIYPVLLIQPGVSLYDMLSVSKKESAGDMLRKMWKQGPNGEWVPASKNEAGAKRLTYKNINWTQYGRYAEDGAAVNRKFMLELVAPLYGPANPDEVKGAEKDPMTTITKKIKAADIGYRWILEPLERTSAHSDDTVKRPTLEAMSSSTVVFNELALGVHGLIGRGAIKRFFNMVEEVLPQELAEGGKNNLYTTLRNIEDLLPNKQGYDHYADTFFIAALAQAKAMGPVAISSDLMARATTVRFEKSHTTEVGQWADLKEIPLK